MSADFTPEQEDYKKIGAFKFFCIQNFPFIANDFDQMTYYELLCKLAEYMKKLIENNNALINNQEALLNAFDELQSYVNTYFDDLNIQEQVNNKLDEMAQDGTLTALLENYGKLIKVFQTDIEMIEDETLIDGQKVMTFGKYNVNDGNGGYYIISSTADFNYILLNNGLYANKISNSQNSIKKSNLTKTYASLWIVDNHTENYIKTRIDMYYKAGITGIVLLAHIANGAITETIEALNFAKNYTISKGMECNTIKFHFTFGSHDLYKSLVLSTLTAVQGITNVYVYNEANAFIEENIADIVTFINVLKSLNYKVGMSCTSQGFRDLNVKESWQPITTALDIVGYNFYPRICAPGIKGTSAKSVAVWNEIDNYRDRFPDKKVVISETGILPYMEFLEQPSLYRIQDYPTQTPTVDAQKIFFYGLLNKLNLNVVDSIYFWFTESWTNETIDFISQYIKGGTF